MSHCYDWFRKLRPINMKNNNDIKYLSYRGSMAKNNSSGKRCKLPSSLAIFSKNAARKRQYESLKHIKLCEIAQRCNN